jgi:hypothetical protein
MPLTEQDLATIRAAIEKDQAAVRRADWDTITRMFTPDAIRFPPQAFSVCWTERHPALRPRGWTPSPAARRAREKRWPPCTPRSIRNH